MAGFERRRKGQRVVSNIMEQGGDSSQLNRMAPRVFAPTSADAGRMQRINEGSQRDMLEKRTLDTRRFNQQNIEDAARMAESNRRFDIGRSDVQDRFDATRGDANRRFDLGREDTLKNRDDINRRFDIGRGDTQRRFDATRRDTLMGKYRPEDVDVYLGGSGGVPRTAEDTDPGFNPANREVGAQLQTLPPQPIGMRRPDQTGGTQLRPRQAASSTKPMDFTKNMEALSTDLEKLGYPADQLFDPDSGDATRQMKSIAQSMNKSIAGGMPQNEALLNAIAGSGIKNQGQFDKESYEGAKEFIKAGKGSGVAGFLQSDDYKTALKEVSDYEQNQSQQQGQPRSFTGDGPVRSGQAGPIAGLRRPSPTQAQPPVTPQAPAVAPTPATPVIGRPVVPELPSGAQRERGSAIRERGDLAAFEGMNARVGNKNNVPGVFVQDPGTGKQQFIGENELKQHFGEDFELGAQSAQTGEDGAISFRANMVKLPGGDDGTTSVADQRAAFGPTQAQTPTAAGQQVGMQRPATATGGQADQSTLSRFDRVNQKLGGKLVEETLEAIDRGDIDDKRAASPKIREMLANPDRYGAEMTNKYLDAVNFWEQPVQSDPQKRKVEMETPPEQRAKEKRDRWANRYMSKVITDAAGSGNKAYGRSKVGYKKALNFYKQQNPNKTERDFELELIELQGGLREPVLRYWSDKSELGDVEISAGEGIRKRSLKARGK